LARELPTVLQVQAPIGDVIVWAFVAFNDPDSQIVRQMPDFVQFKRVCIYRDSLPSRKMWWESIESYYKRP
jgi:hypothetical protein